MNKINRESINSDVDKTLIKFQDKSRQVRKKRFLNLCLILTLFYLFFFKSTFASIPSALFIDLARVEPGQKAWQPAWAAGFGVSFPITPNLFSFFNFSRWGFEISARDNRLLGGRLTLSPLSTGFYILIFPRKALSPLFSLGAGYFFAQYQFNRKDIITIPEIIKLTKEIKGRFSWQAGTGLRVHLSRRVYLWLLVERYQTSLSIETTIIDLNFGTIRSKEAFQFTPLLYRLGLQMNI